MEPKIFHLNDDKGRLEFYDSIKYWSNALGELHRHGQYDISETDLPDGLRHAYDDLFFKLETGSFTYLVETEKGYGIALINEYDECYADDCGLSMENLFQSAIQDTAVIAADPIFAKTEIFLGEFMGFDNSHAQVVVVPADLSLEELEDIAAQLDSLVYQSAKSFEKPSLDAQIQSAADRTGSHTPVEGKSHTHEI